MRRRRLLPSFRSSGAAPTKGAAVALFFEVGILLHTFLRAQANNFGQGTLSAGPLESYVFHGDPAMWLQRWTPRGVGIEWLAAVVHFSWFVIPPLFIWMLYKQGGRGPATKLIAVLLGLLLSADVVFAIMPTRPPWMDLDVDRLVVIGYGSKASLDENAFAAVPSLHVAVPMLYALWFARDTTPLRRFAPWLALWTLAVAWAAVYSGEHYALDAFAGAAWAVVTYAAFLAATTAYERLALRRLATPLALSTGHLPAPLGRAVETEK
jgi:hypothetical protein